MRLMGQYDGKWRISLVYVSRVLITAIAAISINLLVVYRESVNLIGYITRRLSADSQQL